ncbi:MAG: acetolactate synthase large subunit, partial [Candidatus Hydrogenedentes bacterium]|nr:acetolactate synthase large subunit [Candidatus Hydrogenedentota bacterium]
MKASDLFVKALEAEDVEYVFGIPGEENLDLLDSLRNSNIELILTRHEQAAGFMAATYGRLTGKAGVCMSTLGPGATNLVTPAAYAQLGGMPIVMITGQKPVKKSKQGHFQIIDAVDMMRPITKFTRQLVSGNNIPARVREAFRMAEEERPGASHLELPEDVAAEQTDAHLLEISRVRRPTAEDKAIRFAIEMIEAAKSPLLLIGAAANRKLTSKMLREFIDKTGIPFFTTQMGKGVVDERDPLFMGNAALSANDFVHRAIEAADLIINVGHDVIEKPPFFMGKEGRK